ncbi:MAG: hypothetical protein WCO56_24875 [Verrucomicrobiota bacterium]
MKPKRTPIASAKQPQKGCYYRITYSNAGPDDEPKFFQGRDGIAFSELTASLPSSSYDFGTTIHFYPDDERTLGEFPKFSAQDMLVLPTRPPLSDRESDNPTHKIICDSQNELEKLIFNQLFRYFKRCSRRHIQLKPEALDLLAHDPDKWGFLEFFVNSARSHPNGQAFIQKHVTALTKPEKGVFSTVAFLVNVDNLPAFENTHAVPCRFVASFGMDGYTTLIWNRYVRKNHPEWLLNPGFVMAEVVYKKEIPPRPATIDTFADDLNSVAVNILTKPLAEQ